MRIKQYVKYMIDNGIIFEINRTILHPIGLELVVDVSFDNRRQLSIVGLEETDDLDGFLYDDESFELNSDQFAALMEKRQVRLKQREKSLGFIVQEKKSVEDNVQIIINGEKLVILSGVVKYETLIVLAKFKKEQMPSVTYKSKKKSGTLTAGNSVEVEDDMIFNVVLTGNG